MTTNRETLLDCTALSQVLFSSNLFRTNELFLEARVPSMTIFALFWIHLFAIKFLSGQPAHWKGSHPLPPPPSGTPTALRWKVIFHHDLSILKSCLHFPLIFAKALLPAYCCLSRIPPMLGRYGGVAAWEDSPG